ncbi:hypothetical protein LOTGIDRAFT_163520 [Lottia gigantea]|uniref:Uncharacterized protein n=1 Tax=Lottia gigantea TaxID=225164 RepID=V4BQ53_LOTGI|nr:hypothetical protein LOTGIDRAFT_163520 [Lottia gigantea]ESO91004.1 hypothetical protein LOTGIDRAFT_163520 [Lottia gigantea]
MASINSRLPSASADVPEVGIFRKSPAETMRDFARSQQVDETQDYNTSSSSDLQKQNVNQTGEKTNKNASVGLNTNGSLPLMLNAAEPEMSDILPKMIPKRTDEEPGKQLQLKNQHLDLSQYLITDRPLLEFAKYFINRFDDQDDSNGSNCNSGEKRPTVNVDHAVIEDGNEKEKKTSKLKRLRSNLKEFKKRIVRPFTIFTACFSSKAEQ